MKKKIINKIINQFKKNYIIQVYIPYHLKKNILKQLNGTKF